MYGDIRKTWDYQKAEMTTKIKAVEESINWANKKSKALITRGLRSEDNKVKGTCFKQVGDCETKIADLSEQLLPSRRRLCEKKKLTHMYSINIFCHKYFTMLLQ